MKSLEAILQENFDCKKPFLKNKKRYEDGEVQPFTVKGGEAYYKLIDTLYSINTIVDDKEYSHCIEHVIRQLDDICDE